jgi:L,D-transpeptidase YcbB
VWVLIPLAFYGGPGMELLRRYVMRVLAIVLLAVSGSLAQAAAPAEDIRAEISSILSGGRLPLPLERVRAALSAHYLKQNGAIYWVNSNRMSQFLQRLERAQYDGLNPQDYPAEALAGLRDGLNPDDARSAAEAELYYSAFFISYAADLKIGRVAPQKVDPNLFRNRKTIDSLKVLTELKKQGDPGKFLVAFEPKNRHYQGLKRMLKAYTAAIEQGIDWPVIPQGATLKPGQSDPRIPKVRELLALTGDYEGGGGGSSYDKGLAAAVQKFQIRHGLEAKGLFGKQTVVAMNAAPEQRRQQIILNMERWRWMPDNLGDEHFLVNIASYELEWVKGGRDHERMNVVVGAVATQTPEFSDEMEYVDLNPTWTVPYSIATKEMLPKLKGNAYQYAEEFDLFANGKKSDWGSINWSSYGSGKFPFTFVQRPGPKNALGKVKFMLPNAHNIYLHDTPAKEKFANTTRAFSHGCIRLSRPADLAYSLLGEKKGMSQGEIDAIWESQQLTKVVLPRKIPVHLVYATAFASDNGIEFRSDVYGRDRKLASILFGRPSS